MSQGYDAEAIARRADAVRERLALSDLIGADVRLKARGREHLGLCPFHADAKLGSFSVNDDKAVFKCFSCGAGGDHFKYLELRKGMSFMQALKALEADAGIDFRTVVRDPQWEAKRRRRQEMAARDVERRRSNAEGLWLSGARLHATPAESYLRGRSIDFGRLGRFPGALRCRSGCSYPEIERPFVAMLARMQTPDGVHRATHRTFLDRGAAGWTKAGVDRPKMILGDFAGAAIVLSKGEAGVPLRAVPEGTAVAISEGIEDGLSVALADPGLFVVAAGSLDNIGNVALPPQVSDVILIGQRDREVRDAAALLARRAGDGAAAERHARAATEIDAANDRQIGKLQARGLTVLTMWPSPGFKDFNDQLTGKRTTMLVDGALVPA